VIIVCVAEQKSMMEAELERRNAELIDVRQQLESAQAAVDLESKWCQTDVDELAELREELRKTVEELDIKQNEDGLLREQLQSQLAEIDALHDKVFLSSNATIADPYNLPFPQILGVIIIVIGSSHQPDWLSILLFRYLIM